MVQIILMHKDERGIRFFGMESWVNLIVLKQGWEHLRLGVVVGFKVLNILLGSEEDGRTSVNGLGLDIQHSLATSRCTTTSLLDQERHGEALVQNAELSVLGLAVGWVAENASVKHCTVDIGDHRTDIASRVGGLLGVRGELERVEVFCAGTIPVLGVTLVDGVDLSTRRDLDL